MAFITGKDFSANAVKLRTTDIGGTGEHGYNMIPVENDGTPVGLSAKLGSLTETAPSTDTASSGLNGRLQRIAQHLASLIAGLVATPTSIFHVTTASTNGASLVAAPCKLRSLHVSNKDDFAIFVRIHNTAGSVTPGTTAVLLPFMVNGGQSRDIVFPGAGLSLSGFGISVVKNGGATADVGAVGAGSLIGATYV